MSRRLSLVGLADYSKGTDINVKWDDIGDALVGTHHIQLDNIFGPDKSCIGSAQSIVETHSLH